MYPHRQLFVFRCTHLSKKQEGKENLVIKCHVSVVNITNIVVPVTFFQTNNCRSYCCVTTSESPNNLKTLSKAKRQVTVKVEFLLFHVLQVSGTGNMFSCG